MVLCIELEFNSNCKCISNVDVDCSGYNDVIDLSARGIEIIMWILVYFRKSPSSILVRGIGDVNADSKQEPGDWTLRAHREVEGKKDQGYGEGSRNLKERSCLMMFKKGL